MTVPDGQTSRLEVRAAAATSRSSTLGLTADGTLPIDSVAAYDLAIGDLPRVSIDGLEELGGSSTATTGADLIGLGTLGQGGMGRVLLARQRSLARDVAVKTPNEGASRTAAAGLVREGRVAGSLEHPGIVPVHALGVDADRRPLLVMKRVDGVDWDTLLRDPTHTGWSARLAATTDRLEANLEILQRICETLEFSHSRGIVHRDLKPSNVMVGAFGEVYLVDWGIAMPVGSSDQEIVGTPSYMAPEMAMGEPVDERTDVYLLGSVLHRVLVGSPRHQGVTVGEVVISASLSEPFPYPPSIPARLADLCNRATSRSPASRPQSAHAFRDELLAFLRYRSAFALSDVALTRLEELARLVSDAGDAAPSDLAGAYRLGTEARFAFTQCLQTYPEHAPAREGLRRCLGVLVDLELRQGHVDSAAAVLAELEGPPAALVGRVDTARAEARLAATEHDRLLAVDREFDPAIARRGRAIAFGVVLASSMTLTLVANVRHETYTAESGLPTAYAAILLVLTVTIGAVFRARLLPNAFNRRFASLLVLVETVVVLNRFSGWMRSAPIAVTLSSDLLVLAVGTSAGAILLHRRVWVAVVPIVLGLVAFQVFPAYNVRIWGVSTNLAFALCAWSVWTGDQSER